MKVFSVLDDLSSRLDKLKFAAPVTHVYNPLVYAIKPHRQYWQRYGKGPKEAVFLGMNPGPWGMAQTGVPFGEVGLVRDWMGIEAPVGHPPHEHPKRPVDGFNCTRSEVSGKRLWGWAAERFGSPGNFFDRFFVINYCPLMFMEESGKNRTPDKLPLAERAPLIEACDEALREVVRELSPRILIGVGKFAAKQAALALGSTGPRIESILHPSPASPMANRGWAPLAEKQLIEMGINI